MKKIIALLLIISHLALAEDACTQNVTYLTKGTAAPCSGYLFSPKQEQTVRLAKDSLDNLQQEFNIQTDKITLLNQDLSFYKDQMAASQQQVQLWQAADQKCSQELTKDEEGRFTKDILLFGAGILTTLIAGLALKSVSH